MHRRSPKPHRLWVADPSRQRADGFSKHWVDKIRGKITQWRENKSPLGEARVRDFEARAGNDPLAIKEQVEIEGARCVALGPSGAALKSLDLE